MLNHPLPPLRLPQLHPQHPPENLLHHPPTHPRHRPIEPALAQLIPHKRVLRARDLVPAEVHAPLPQPQPDQVPAGGGDVRVPRAVDAQELAGDVCAAREGVVGGGPERGAVHVGGEVGDGGGDAGVEGGAQGEVAAEAHPRGAEAAGAGRQGEQGADGGVGVGVVGGEGLSGLEGVAEVGAGGGVGQGVGGEEVVVGGGGGDDVARRGEGAREALDGAGDLVDFGVEEEGGEAAASGMLGGLVGWGGGVDWTYALG